MRGIFGLGRLFRIMDDDQSRTLSRAEFEKACRDFKTELSAEDIGTLFGAFDVNRDGVISYDEFLRVIRGQMNDYRRSLAERAFLKLDRNGNGRVEVEELVGVYSAAKHPAVLEGRKTAEQVLSEFLETFQTHHNYMYSGEVEKDEVVTLDEFTEYYNNVSASIDDDMYFAQMMNSSWNLSGDASPYQAYEKAWATKQQAAPLSRPQTAGVGSY